MNYLTEDKSDIALHYKLREYADKLSGRHNDSKSKNAKKAASASNLSSLRHSMSYVNGSKNDTNLKKQADYDNEFNIKRINKEIRKLDKSGGMNVMTLQEAMNYVDNYLTEAAVNKEKQEILDNQDSLKKNFNNIAKDLKEMVLNTAGEYVGNLVIKDDKFFKNHEDHKEQHYLLEYNLSPLNGLSKTEQAKILLDIGNKVEKEFRSSKKEFLDKGLYFDNKKKDATTRFVELHYDFY